MSQDQTPQTSPPDAGIAPRNNASRAVACLIIAIAFGLFGWYAANHAGNWKDLFFPADFAPSSQASFTPAAKSISALIRKVLADNHIQYVISLVLEDPTDTDATAEQAAAKEMGIRWSRFPLAGDGTGDIHNYAGAVAAMADAIEKMNPSSSTAPAAPSASNAQRFTTGYSSNTGTPTTRQQK